MSVEDVKVLLDRASKDLESASKTVEEAASQVRVAFEIAAAAVYDSQHTSVRDGLAKIKDAVAEADHIQRRLRDAIDRVGRYQAGL